MRESELEFSGSDLHCRVPSISRLTSPSHAGESVTVTQGLRLSGLLCNHDWPPP